MDKFTEVYNKIINECNETAKQNKIIEESLLRKVGGLFKSKKGKHEMMKDSIIGWMNANKFKENGAENKFIGTLSNGYQLKFTFSQTEWSNPEATSIKYSIYLYDEEGNKKIIANKDGEITYSYSENDIKKELTKKLTAASTMKKEDAKSSFTTNKQIRKEENKAAKAELKAKKAADKEAAKQKAEEEAKAAAEKTAQELQE